MQPFTYSFKSQHLPELHFCFSKHVKELLWLHKKSENKGLNQLHRCLGTAWMGWILGVAQLHSGHSCARLSRGSDVMYNGSPQGCRNRGMEGRVRWGEVRGGWNQILALRFCCAPQTTGRGLMWSHLLQVLHIWYCPANGDRRGKKIACAAGFLYSLHAANGSWIEVNEVCTLMCECRGKEGRRLTVTVT